LGKVPELTPGEAPFPDTSLLEGVVVKERVLPLGKGSAVFFQRRGEGG